MASLNQRLQSLHRLVDDGKGMFLSDGATVGLQDLVQTQTLVLVQLQLLPVLFVQAGHGDEVVVGTLVLLRVLDLLTMWSLHVDFTKIRFKLFLLLLFFALCDDDSTST